jgi:hypothetical protein
VILRHCLKFTQGCLVSLALLASLAAASASAQDTDSRKPAAMVINFGGVGYLHRWSKNGQNEFTPAPQTNLATWQDMVTVNVMDAVRDADQLAAAANKVLSRYESHGKVLRTNSKPRTTAQPAEHFVAAVLGNPAFLEAAFARLVLVDGVGTVVVYSHRVYGAQAGPAMSDWLKGQGVQAEKMLMAWDKVPTAAALKVLPQQP